jgi:hypothetical protein
MKYGYHYTPCSTGSSGPGLWLLIKLAALAGAAAAVWWALQAIGRATVAAVDTVTGAATAAGPILLGAVGLIGVLFVLAVVMVVVRNNQRPPLVPHDRPTRAALGGSTVEIIDVTPNRKRLGPPQPIYQPLASRPRARVRELVR